MIITPRKKGFVFVSAVDVHVHVDREAKHRERYLEGKRKNERMKLEEDRQHISRHARRREGGC